MSIKRVALVYDHRPRPETTGFYCLRALEKLTAVQHLLPEQLPSVGTREFDLFFCVDDGLAWSWPPRLQPSIYWAIDTHLDYPRTLWRAEQFDLVCAAQQNGSERLREDSRQPVEWLPLACDPELHRLLESESVPGKRFDFSFVGNLFPGPRQDLLQVLAREFPQHFIGQAYFLQMALIHTRSRIVFNRSLRDDLNMRVFEALAAGSLLLTNALDNGQSELFRDGRHLVTYRDQAELLEQMHWYLDHPRERELIAAHGQREVLEKHTYLQRMRRVLELAYEHFFARRATLPV